LKTSSQIVDQMHSRIDKLINSFTHSGLLTEHEIGLLKESVIPTPDEVELFAHEPEVSAILEHFTDQPNEQMGELIKLAKQFLSEGKAESAWKVILQD